MSKLALPGPHNITRTALENGITVLVYENHNAQSVVVTGSLHAGSIYEAAISNGLASMTVAALMRGTQHRDFDRIHAELEDIGADLSFSSGMHRVGFGGKALAEDLPLLVELLADALRYPAFPPDEIERLRGERLTWLQYNHQNTRWLAAQAFRKSLYPPHHPYHYSARGTLESLPGITPAQIAAFHQAHYGPHKMLVVIVGAIETQAALECIRAYLGDWHSPQQPPIATLPAISAPAQATRHDENVPGKTQSDLILGTLGPPRHAPDYQAANLANSILGQFGMMGRLGEVIREREGLAYYAESRMDGGVGPGAWSISAGVNPANVERTIDLCRAELHRLISEPVSTQDLQDNQAYFTGRLPLQLESNEGIASTLHLLEIYELGLDYLLNYHDQIYSLTADDLLAAARHYLDPDALVMAVAGPPAG